MEPAITVRGLRKEYPGGRGVQDVSFDVAAGEIFGVLGRNGAGKSTTVECIAGLRDRDAGQVTVCGIDPAADEPALRRVLGVQLQDAALPEKLTVDDVCTPPSMTTRHRSMICETAWDSLRSAVATSDG